jgi:hypothetical protein
MEDYRAELRFEVKRKVDFLVGDCHTFLAVRTDQFKWFSGDDSLRGGNFLIALGLMALLGVLAKVHLWLIEPEAFVTERERSDVKEAIEKIGVQMPELKKMVKKKWHAPRVGDCNCSGSAGNGGSVPRLR